MTDLLTGVTASAYAMGDVDGNGRLDLISGSSSGALRLRRNLGTNPPGLMTTLTDGFGNRTSFEYRPISSGNCYTRSNAAPAANTHLRATNRGQYVACKMTSSDGSGGTYDQSFSYENARFAVGGRGYAGFAKRSVTDSRTNVTVTDIFNQSFPFVGMSTHSLMTRQSGAKIREVWNEPTSIDYPNSSAPLTRFPYSFETRVETYEVGGPQNGALIGRTTTTRGLDAYGNLVDETVTAVDLDGDLSADRRNFVVTTHHDITNDTGTWCLGKSHRSTVTRDLPDGQAHTQIETIGRDIDYVACRVDRETLEPSGQGTPPTPLTVVTDFEYLPAGCGNPTAISVQGYSETGAALPVRRTSFGYGAQCRFPETITNALNQTTVRTYRYDLGLIDTETDPNGLKTKYEYDNLGRLQIAREFFETSISTSVTTDYVACRASNNYCGSPDLRMAVVRSTVDAQGATVRIDTTYLDGLERERIVSAPLATGEMSHVETRYNPRGLVSWITEPYTSSSNGRTVYVYDDLGRQTAAELRNAADVTIRSSIAVFEGRTVRLTNPRGHVTAKIYDVAGQLRRTTDPLVSAPSSSGSTSYDYALEAGGVLASSVTDAANNVSVVRTNKRGFKTQMVDPDMGTWTYAYNSLGELVRQTDANQAVAGTWTSFTYDALGRMRTRSDAGSQTASWTYDGPATYAGEKTIGRLTSVTGQGGYSEAYIYDTFGRPSTDRMTAEGVSYDIGYTYQSLGLVDTVTYPQTVGTRLAVKYEYQYGAAIRVLDANTPSLVYWQVNAMNARGQITQEQMGANGSAGRVQIATGYDPTTGLMSSRQAGTQGSASNRQNLSYLWDANGNLERRTDANQGTLYERFYYDELNRLDYSTLTTSAGTTTNLDLTYDAIGNIKRKSDVSSSDYNYTAAQSGCSYYSHTQPHAVRSAGSVAYCYDRNGNMTRRGGHSIAWNHLDLPTSIAGPSGTSSFNYGPSGNRWKQVATSGAGTETTIYAWGALEKVTYGAGATAYRHYISAGENTVVHTRWSNGTASQTHYATTDHLGSTTTITDITGNLVSNASFDAFGKRRNSNWQGAITSAQLTALTNVTRHGYTGHEHLDNLDLIHMNGRVQDPHLGRFISADPIVQAPEFSQSLNRYAYVWNNPGSMIDPSGFEATCYGTLSLYCDHYTVAEPWGGQFTQSGAINYADGTTGPAAPPTVRSSDSVIYGFSVRNWGEPERPYAREEPAELAQFRAAYPQVDRAIDRVWEKSFQGKTHEEFVAIYQSLKTGSLLFNTTAMVPDPKLLKLRWANPNRPGFPLYRGYRLVLVVHSHPVRHVLSPNHPSCAVDCVLRGPSPRDIDTANRYASSAFHMIVGMDYYGRAREYYYYGPRAGIDE